jgi:hypothetical protein
MTLKELEIAKNTFKEKEKNKNYAENQRTAMICCIIANANRDPKKKSTPFKINDFMPQEKKKMTAEQIEKFLKMLTLAMGGDVVE